MSQPASIKPSGQSLLRTFERVLGDRDPSAQPKRENAGVLKPAKNAETHKTFEFYGRNGNVKEADPYRAGSRFDHTV
ncbi:hypothetical protein [Rhodohalobacter mucosus]|uniref:Uncharacterized protein n=1 Tax=Rhodohalobacter mucosus TaxID=2079485 RepID=A0A316TLC1_9BACT|nr:hypothetical protein [Rhodohalobacter mucosus]PWN05170.1 hypothetical protein DDZ15_15715 [Rhodohalobacter mucosus]